MRRNHTAVWDVSGEYLTDLFTKEAVHEINNHDKRTPLFLYLPHIIPHAPLQAPQDEIDKFSYIKNSNRSIYAAMISKLDQSIGHVIKALDENDMLNNTVILFFADNGAPVLGLFSNAGSNYPFRGVSWLD